MVRLCAMCAQQIPQGKRLGAIYCSDRCRATARNAQRRSKLRQVLGTAPCRNSFCDATLVPLKGKVYCSRACQYVSAQAKYGKGAAEAAAIKVGQLVASRIWYFSCQDCGATMVRKWKRPGVYRLCGTCSRRRYLEHNARKNHKRRAPGLPVLSVYQIAERDGCRCNICGRKVNLKLSGRAKYGPTIDHLTPISRGGTNAADNLALAHRACNVARGNRAPAQLLLTA